MTDELKQLMYGQLSRADWERMLTLLGPYPKAYEKLKQMLADNNLPKHSPPSANWRDDRFLASMEKLKAEIAERERLGDLR